MTYKYNYFSSLHQGQGVTFTFIIECDLDVNNHNNTHIDNSPVRNTI